MLIQSIENMTVNYVSVAGIIATIIGILSFLPVIYVVYKSKNTSNFPYNSLVLAITSNLLWIYYAISNKPQIDYPLAIKGTVYLLIYTYILFTKSFVTPTS